MGQRVAKQQFLSLAWIQITAYKWWVEFSRSHGVCESWRLYVTY